jgi:hypothetical protein
LTSLAVESRTPNTTCAANELEASLALRFAAKPALTVVE